MGVFQRVLSGFALEVLLLHTCGLKNSQCPCFLCVLPSRSEYTSQKWFSQSIRMPSIILRVTERRRISVLTGFLLSGLKLFEEPDAFSHHYVYV